MKRLRAGEIYRSLGMGDAAADARECERNQRRPHDVRRMEKILFGEELCPPLGGGIGRPIERFSNRNATADSQASLHLR